MQPDPPKAERILDRERLRKIELLLTILSKLSDVPKKTIRARRKSGAKGRSLRRIGVHYAHYLGSPQWEQRHIFQLDRKQLGQEEVAISKRLESDPNASLAVGFLFDAMTLIGRINVPDLLGLATNSRPQTARSVDKEFAVEIPIEEEAPAKPQRKPAWNPATDAKPEVLRRQQEAAELAARGQLKRQLASTESAIRIAKAVIQTGAAEGAGKEARTDAKRAAKDLEALMKKERSLIRALGEVGAKQVE